MAQKYGSNYPKTIKGLSAEKSLRTALCHQLATAVQVLQWLEGQMRRRYQPALAARRRKPLPG